MKPQPWSFDHLLNTPPDNQSPQSPAVNDSSPFQENVASPSPDKEISERLETPDARAIGNSTSTLFNGAGSEEESDSYSPAPADALISPAEWLSGKSPSRNGKKVLAPVTPVTRNAVQCEDFGTATPDVESPLSLNPALVDAQDSSMHQDETLTTAELNEKDTPAPEEPASPVQQNNATFGHDVSQTLIDIPDNSQYQTPPGGKHAATLDSKTLTLSSPVKSHVSLVKKKTKEDTPSPTEVRYLGMPDVRKWLSRNNTVVSSPTQEESKADPEEQNTSAEEVTDVGPAEEDFSVPGEWIESDDPSRGRTGSLTKLRAEGKHTSGQNHRSKKKKKYPGLDKATRPGKSHGSPSQHYAPPCRRAKGDRSGKPKASRSRVKMEDYEEVQISFSPDFRPDKSFERVEVNGQQQILVHLPKTTVKIPPDVPRNWNPSLGVPLADNWPEKEELEKMTPEEEERQKEALRQEQELERLEKEHLERLRREEEADERRLWQEIREKAAAVEAQQAKEWRDALVSRMKERGMNTGWATYWEEKEKDKALDDKKRQEEEEAEAKAEAERQQKIAKLHEKMDEVHKQRVAARAKGLAKRVMQEGLRMKVLCLERGAASELAMECADAYTEHVMANVFVNLIEGGDLARFED